MKCKHTLIFGDSRSLPELGDGTVQLVVTSPPYWNRKDYGGAGQIGFGQVYETYLEDIRGTWSECYRVLEPGRRLCINIMDLFTSTERFGRHKCIALGADTTRLCEEIGFDYMGTIIWRRIGNCSPSGGGNVLGSFPYPPNGLPKFDYEYILLFKKRGPKPEVPREVKEASAMTSDEWFTYFSGVWNIQPHQNRDHGATFPVELPRRMIKMFTFVGETVLDPFLGSGSTMAAAIELGRNSVGKELNQAYLPLIRRRAGFGQLTVTGDRVFELVSAVPGSGDRKEEQPSKIKDGGRREGEMDRFFAQNT
jgi:modification methylase